MAGSGPRPPHFSEDFAWLPAWLQPYEKLSLQEKYESLDQLSQFSGKNFLRDNHILEAPRRPLCSKADSDYSSFHLFLSGETCATVTTTQSSANLLSFHLHLSSSLSVPDSASLIRATRQEDRRLACSVHVTSEMKKKETSEQQGPPILPEPQLIKFDAPPEIITPKVLAKRSPKIDDRKDRTHLEDLFNDAVELSVAASEALVISEIVNCEPSVKSLCASSIIEAALKVKQTRNEHCLNVINKVSAASLHEVDKNDDICEMDEISMKEAFEDVGLHIYSDAENDGNIAQDNCSELSGSTLNEALVHGDSSPVDGSFVRNTFVSDLERNEFLDLNDSFHNLDRSGDKIILPEQKKKLYLDPDAILQNGFFDAPSSDGNSTSVRNGRPTCQCESSQTDPKVLATENNILNQTDPKVLATENNILKEEVMIKAMMRNEDIVADDGDNVGCNAKERLIDHWLSGGIGKLKKSKTGSNGVHEIDNGKKGVPKYFEEKVSYISESVILATEESSVHNSEEVEPEVKNSHLVTKEVQSSQDVGSSNFPSLDPLCSIVPCSISSDKECVAPRVFYQKSWGDAHGNCINSERLDVEAEGFDSMKGTLISASISKRRQLASLVAYSKFVPTEIIGSKDDMFCLKQLPVCAAGGINMKQPGLCASLGREAIHIAEIQDLSEYKDHVNVEGNFSRKMEYPSPKKHKLSEPSPHKPGLAVLNAVAQSPVVSNYGSPRRQCASKFIPNDEKEKFSEGNRVKKKKNVLKTKCQLQPKFCNISSCLRLSTTKNSELNKRVRFAERELSVHHCQTEYRQSSGYLSSSRGPFGKRKRDENVGCRPKIREESNNLISCRRSARARLIFHGLKFLLTGYAQPKERELEMTIRKNGGIILNDFPSPLRNMKRRIRSKHKNEDLPLVLSPDKNQTVTFLHGCAVNAILLRTEWLTDSVSAGYPLAPNNYLILLHQKAECKLSDGIVFFHSNYQSIFAGVGIMFSGKLSFCSTYAKIVKRGGGQVFKTLHWLVQSLKNGRTNLGVVVVEDDSRASRHLRQCVLENKLQILHISWIINCLHSGKIVETNIGP